MSEHVIARMFLRLAVVVGVVAAATACWSPRAAAGLLAGGVWNLANLWCLMQMLRAWLGPGASRRRVVLWVVLKFPLLYAAAFGLLQLPGMSAMGFGLGFSLVLLSVLGWYVMRLPAVMTSRSHVR